MIKFQKRLIEVHRRDNKCTLSIYKLSVVSNGKTNIISNKNNTISKLKFVIVKIKKYIYIYIFIISELHVQNTEQKFEKPLAEAISS